MSDEELIARLRQHDGWVTLEAHTHLTAADRIEALLDALEASQAKLAKAVELLTLCRDMFDEVAHPSDPLSVMLNQTLAEIKGESHE